MRYIRNFINRRKITKENLFKSKELLDNVNGYSLDKKQRLAVIDSSDSALLLAGAGSGKTLTIVGKIRYLIEILKIKKKIYYVYHLLMILLIVLKMHYLKIITMI